MSRCKDVETECRPRLTNTPPQGGGTEGETARAVSPVVPPPKRDPVRPAGANTPDGGVPQHIAIIMDGNGRWAQQRGLPRLAGHRAGTENVRRIVEACADLGVKIITLYAFSTENWTRPAEEVDGLMSLLSQVIDRETEDLRKNGVRLGHLGSLEGLPSHLRSKIERGIAATAAGDRILVNVALNYGGRREIVMAVQRLMKDGLSPEQVTEEVLSHYLYTADLPDPDLIIRTAGEMRLSNFLIWQAAYAEFYATPAYWPDFDRQELEKALLSYAQRQRKFGGLIP
jgi:undecaprenyl diphosphate synthase